MNRILTGLIALSFLLFQTACNPPDPATVATTSVGISPSHLAYAFSISAITGEPIANQIPTYAGTVQSFSVSPSLPQGLLFNSKTGAVSGTPNQSMGSKSYTVTATNSTGSTSAILSISISARTEPTPPPTALNIKYSSVIATYARGSTIAPNVPTVLAGTVTSYAVAPPLPLGLILNISSGIISGTPIFASPQTRYVITASNSINSTTITLSITVSASSAQCANGSFSPPASDPDYRAMVMAAASQEINFPAYNQSWKVTYTYITPPLPCSPTWNSAEETFYIWGDIDFDEYGPSGSYPLSNNHYRYNQITPQLTLGNGLVANNAAYQPSWQSFSTWVVQAQYFWMNNDGTPYAQTGPLIHVNPGDSLTTVISYDATTGAITASITAPEGTSSILINHPFPNDSTYSSWSTFFEQAQARTGALIGRPEFNVETHYTDPQTICSVLPMAIASISAPGIGVSGSNYLVSPYGNFSCPGPLAILGF